MKFSLLGQNVLFTGASSGIGRDTAMAMAKKGAKLAISSRSGPSLERLADAIEQAGGTRPRILVADLSRRGEALRLAARAQTELGPIDVLVNNAGIGLGGSQWNVGDSDEGREVFQTNYWSPMALIEALVPGMRARKHGAVINVASLACTLPFPMTGHYSSSKAALTLAADTLRLELRGSGVNSILVLPGPVETPMLAELKLLPGIDRSMALAPIGDSATLAKLIVRGIERGAREVVYPRPYRFARWFPKIAGWFAASLMSEIDTSDERVVRGGTALTTLAK